METPRDPGSLDVALTSLKWKISSTAKIRFRCSARMKLHERYSQWSLALLSIFIVLMSLLETVDILRVDPPIVNISTSILGVALLTMSLLFGHEEFGLRSDQMHRCGIELNNLASRVPQISAESTGWNAYEKALKEYTSILRRYGNHAYQDYLMHKIQVKDQYYNGHWQDKLRFISDWLKVRFVDTMRFIVYFVPIISVLLWLISSG